MATAKTVKLETPAERMAAYHYHAGHMHMAQTLRLVGGLPKEEQAPFVGGMLRVIEKWLTGEHDATRSKWPNVRLRGTAPRKARRAA